ncbi:hypothetical protein VPNG_02986 [Cytospora leucostoma]|uniref:Mitochondrial intermembrane space import and assembly protein 40 n=1 Tax=Cytospora leucostoma TaxID=1230097 RepID=A0A423XGL8_9PEZI|nr:hypothetical protein VPNG_02986 [Cytospora leucostoma]
MFRAAIRSTPRALRQTSAISSAGRRFASTAPADKSYTWKGTVARWGLAVGALYWYNTSPIFADEVPSRLTPEPAQFSESDIKTVDAIVEEKRKQLDAKLRAKEEQASKQAEAAQSATPQQTPPPAGESESAVATPADAEKSPEQLEEEAGQQGAFNPETGEINWDCPCLGGMADGPCGEEFKSAFSCFVYSDVEPKGMDCIDKFQHMQDCFRKYPDIYGAEIADEEAADREVEEAVRGSPAPTDAQPKEVAKEVAGEPATPAQPGQHPVEEAKTVEHPNKELAKAPTEAPKQILKDELTGEQRGIPNRSFDATSANKKESK